MSAAEPVKSHPKYINIDWDRHPDGFMFMRSWLAVPCQCEEPWRHYP